MKARIIVAGLAVCLLVSTPSARSQSWIGEAIGLDTSYTLACETLPSDLNHLCLFAHDSLLYITDQRAFQHAGNDYAAHVCALSLRDGSIFEFNLPFPPSQKSKEWLANTFWIKDFCFFGNRCAVSVQDHLLLYHRTSANLFEYDTILDRTNVKAVYFHQNSLYFLEEDHDMGYKWFKFDFKKGEESLVRELLYEAPHVVQASPNRYLFHDENKLYAVSTRYPILQEYRLDGTWLRDIRFDLPDWHPFEDEYIQKSLQVPYGVERIFATKGEIYHYSYLKAVFPLQDQYLIYYTQYYTLSGKSAPMFALADSTGHATLFDRRCPSNHLFQERRFPFNLFQPLEDLGRTSWRNLLLEVTADCDIPWDGRTVEEYHTLKENFFRQNDPILKVRIMRLNGTDFEHNPFFLNSRQEQLSLSQLPKGKHVFILHNELECSSCSNFLLQSMNALDSDYVHLGLLYVSIPGALRERETHRNIRQYLNRPYDLYCLIPGKPERFPHFISQNVRQFPAVLFYETGRAPILFSSEQIFDDDPFTYRFRTEFQQILDEFATKSAGGH